MAKVAALSSDLAAIHGFEAGVRHRYFVGPVAPLAMRRAMVKSFRPAIEVIRGCIS